MPLHVSSICAHHQGVKVALHSLWYNHTYRCDDTRGCVMQFWPPDDEHMWSKHVEAWNKLIVKQKLCASSWLNTEINTQRMLSSASCFKHQYFLFLVRLFISWSRDSSFGIATCGLDGPGIESRWRRDFQRPSRPALRSSQYNVYRVFHVGKAAGVWRWPDIPSSADVKERVELYLYSYSGPSLDCYRVNFSLLFVQ